MPFVYAIFLLRFINRMKNSQVYVNTDESVQETFEKYF